MAEKICDNCMSRVPIEAGRCPKCGIRFENTNPGGALPSGWVLSSRYTIGRYVDIDGEGVTYAAIDANTLQRVKIKEFMPVTLCATRNERGEIIPKPGCEVLFKTTRMDFQELYTILRRIGFSEGLVQVLDVLEANNTMYAVLEQVEGPSLSEYMARMEKPLDGTRTQALMRSVIMGLETLHAANIIHRGICPDNIVLESGGTAKLTGYGTLALRQQGSELKPKLYAGFSAPEQYSASGFEGKYTDVYALGSVMYRMVCGEVPLSADERMLQDTLRTARAVNKEVPVYLSSAIAHAMRVNPEERIDTVDDLRLAISGDGSRSHGKKKGGFLQDGLFGLTKQQTIVGGVALAAVALILVAVLIIVLFSKNAPPPVSGTSISTVSDSGMFTEVPDFDELRYEDLIKEAKYTKYFTFAEPKEEYSDDVDEGRVMGQSPAKGTPYKVDASGEKMEMTLTVSKGKEPVDMPDFVSVMTLRDEAVLRLKELEVEYTELSSVNNGEYQPGQVVKTDPVAGTKITPGKDVVKLYVASKAVGKTMPEVKGQTEAAAKSALDSAGIKYSIDYVNTNFGSEVGKVIDVSHAAGTTITGNTVIVLKVGKTHVMPDLSGFIGKPLAELKTFLDARSIPYGIATVAVPVPAESGKTVDTVAKIEGNITNGPVTSITITYYV